MSNQESKAEVKKSLQNNEENFSQESEDQFDFEKKKRNVQNERNEMLREFIDRLSSRYRQNDRNIFKYGHGRYFDADENMSSPFGSNENDFESGYYGDEDDLMRLKKNLIKKKRFREYFKKRNIHHNRYGNFREHY